MSTELKALTTLLQHNTQKFDTWIEEVLNFDTEALKKAMGTIEYLCEDTFLDIQEKLLDYSSDLESSYEDGDIIFSHGFRTQTEFWGIPTVDFEPSYEEEEFWSNISKIKEACL